MTWIGWAARRLGVYRAVRYSTLYDRYARVIRPGYAGGLANDRRFYRALFDAHGVRSVFDIGANVGDKARVFRELAGRVVCVEADPELVDTLRFRFRNRSGVEVEHVAVGESIGTAVLHRKRFAGFNTLSEKWSGHSAALAIESRDTVTVQVTSLDRLIAAHGRPDYIKIDVEGYELPALRGLTTAVRVISFESNLPVFLDETLLAIDRLAGLDPAYRFNARQGDRAGFALPGHIGRDDMTRFVTASGTATYDLFAINSSTDAGGPD